MKEEVIYTVTPGDEPYYRVEEFIEYLPGQGDSSWYAVKTFHTREEAAIYANEVAFQRELPTRVVKVTASE